MTRPQVYFDEKQHCYHRCTSQGTGRLQPPESGKAIIFRANAKFCGQKPEAKNEKNVLYLLNEKNGIHSLQRAEVPKVRIFTNIIGWGESGKAVLNKTLLSIIKQFQFVDSVLFGQVRWTVFSGTVEIFFSGKYGSASLEKFVRTPMIAIRQSESRWPNRECRTITQQE